jgi:adenine specific DNA methylase Mod
MIYERLKIMHELLADNGSIYVHCDWRVSPYIKIILDEIFNENNFQNEIIIHYTAVGLKALSKKFHQNTETVFYYAKDKGNHIWNIVYEKIKNEDGYRTTSKHVWDPVTGKAQRLRDENGKIVYFEVTENKADNFIELPALRGDKKFGYPTQKHEDLLERIIKASSNHSKKLQSFWSPCRWRSLEHSMALRFLALA